MDAMNPIGFRVLIAVAEHGSFAAAAKALGIEQSAVTGQIDALEVGSDLSLFDRQGESVRLTPAGSRMLPQARRVVDGYDSALNA